MIEPSARAPSKVLRSPRSHSLSFQNFSSNLQRNHRFKQASLQSKHHLKNNHHFEKSSLQSNHHSKQLFLRSNHRATISSPSTFSSSKSQYNQLHLLRSRIHHPSSNRSFEATSTSSPHSAPLPIRQSLCLHSWNSQLLDPMANPWSLLLTKYSDLLQCSKNHQNTLFSSGFHSRSVTSSMSWYMMVRHWWADFVVPWSQTKTHIIKSRGVGNPKKNTRQAEQPLTHDPRLPATKLAQHTHKQSLK